MNFAKNLILGFKDKTQPVTDSRYSHTKNQCDMKKAIFFLLATSFFTCQNSGEQQKAMEAADKMSPEMPGQAMPDASLQDLFEKVKVVKMHLFGTTEADPDPEVYPYVGKLIPESVHGLLGEKLNAAKGPVFACYYAENNRQYILRVPGRDDVSGDLVLAMWDGKANQLVKVNQLASISCEGGTCLQQDSWLIDIDDDRDLELISRSHKRDGKGMISDEQFLVFANDGSGHFQKANKKLT